MPSFDGMTWLDATAMADMVRRKEVTPNELVEAAVGRIERVNPQLNAGGNKGEQTVTGRRF